MSGSANPSPSPGTDQTTAKLTPAQMAAITPAPAPPSFAAKYGYVIAFGFMAALLIVGTIVGELYAHGHL